MCRLLGYFAIEEDRLGWALQEAPRSLLRQSHINRKRLQKDGWGAVWYDNATWRLKKSPKAIFSSPRVLTSISRAKSTSWVAHIRAASNPEKRPRREIIGLRHTQPFRHGSWVFVHNGTLNRPTVVKRRLGRWKQFVRGNNDSEVLFYWLMKTFVSGKGSVMARLRKSLNDLDKLSPYVGLNWILTDGHVLYAFCYVNQGGFGRHRSLISPHPFFQLHVRRSSTSLLVVSEPIDRKRDWQTMRHGELLFARREAKSLNVRSFQIR